VSRLNAPRTIDYEFRVFEHDDWVWLYDESARSYPCTAQPHIDAEPLYPAYSRIDDCDERTAACEAAYDEAPPEPGLFLVGRPTGTFAQPTPAMKGSLLVMTLPFDMDEREAWDEAREDAQGNCLI
jgi:hypothetical protein